MFSPMGFKRGFPRQPGSWQAGPPAARPYGPQDMWDEVPQHRRGRGQWCSPYPWEPFPGPAAFHVHEEDRGWAPNDCLPPPSWHNEECDQGPEECFGEGWYSPLHSEPRYFPDPDDFYENEENRRWGPHDRLPSRHWDNAECDQRPEVCFEDGWYPEMMQPGSDFSTWPDFPNEGQRPLWPPAHHRGEQDGFQDGYRPWGFQGPPRRHCHHRRPQTSTMVLRHTCAWPRGYQPPSQSSTCSGKIQPVIKKEPQPLIPIKPSVQSRQQEAKDLPAASQEVPECPEATSTSQESLATGPQVVTEDLKPEQAAGAMLVEPCSQGSPEAGAGSCPSSPTAPPEPAEPPQGQQCKAEDASAEVPPESPTKPKVEPGEASSYTCIKPETSPGSQPPPGSSEVKPATGDLHQLCSSLPNPSPASTDLRSAAVLAKKEKIELSYQQFSLTIAVVATMLLQKEPSMEAALGLALRANLRQGRIHHLQELEDFINSYDSATLSH